MNISRKLVVAAAGLFILALLTLVFLASPMFHVTHVVIDGNIRTPDEEIIGRLRVHETTNLVFFGTRAARERLMENFFIGDVSFRRELPNILHVEIYERRLMGYVEHLGFYLYLDDFGTVLDIRSYMYDPRPLLTGLHIRSFQLGERIDVPDTVALHAVVHYSLLLYHHELIDRVTRMDVSDTNNIRILVNYWEFNVGGVMGADEKLRVMIAMLDAMPDYDMMRGRTDLRHLGPQFFFEILQ